MCRESQVFPLLNASRRVGIKGVVGPGVVHAIPVFVLEIEPEVAERCVVVNSVLRAERANVDSSPRILIGGVVAGNIVFGVKEKEAMAAKEETIATQIVVGKAVVVSAVRGDAVTEVAGSHVVTELVVRRSGGRNGLIIRKIAGVNPDSEKVSHHHEVVYP